MDREILFRGKRLDNGEWVFGYPVCCGNVAQIGTFNVMPFGIQIGNGYAVAPTTVGQYTGLTDKNGKKIFEGDICRIGNLTFQVVFQYSQWRFSITTPDVYCNPYFDSHCGEHCEVIGNIHDHPELMGGEGDG